jgi:hypothetical protein
MGDFPARPPDDLARPLPQKLQQRPIAQENPAFLVAEKNAFAEGLERRMPELDEFLQRSLAMLLRCFHLLLHDALLVIQENPFLWM